MAMGLESGCLRVQRGVVAALFVVLLFFAAPAARGDVQIITDPAEWEAMVTGIEEFATTADNVVLADEVDSLPMDPNNAQLGPVLTFQAANTGLSRGFILEALQQDAGFTFNETEQGQVLMSFQDALSVGDVDNYEDDDWSLSLTDGSTMTAFSVEVRHTRFEDDETLTLYSDGVAIATFPLNELLDSDDTTAFLGIVSDEPFDAAFFDENSGSDDIAIADFRFAEAIIHINAKVDLKPETINLKSRGRYVTVYIELPGGYSVRDIVPESVVISGIGTDVIEPPLETVGPTNIGNRDRDRYADLMVKFSRRELIRLLKVTDRSITISGELKDGTTFSGTDKIRVKCKKCSKKTYKKLVKKHKKYQNKQRGKWK